jgi:hypothetical protein
MIRFLTRRDVCASSANSGPIYRDKSTCGPEQTSGLNFPFQPHLRIGEARPQEASMDGGKIVNRSLAEFLC